MRININGYPISAKFGAIDSVHRTPHKGVDVAVPEGTPIHAVEDGVVLRINDDGPASFGKSIRIRLEDGTDVTYGHLSDIDVKTGEIVHAGEAIGLSGNTGRSTGPHLHIQAVRDGEIIDPTRYVDAAVGEPSSGGGGFIGWLNGIGDAFIEKEVEWLLAPLFRMLREAASQIIEMVNANSAEIITLGIVACAGGMMLAPMFGSPSGRWMGRMFAVFWVGVVWRVIIL